ncbi:MAG: TRAP transporter small permease [Alphaproteobacteria bacterium]
MLAALERIAVAATRLLSVIGLTALMTLAVMTIADGLMRWLLNQPIEGVRDLGGLAIALAIACCLPVVMSEGGNITIRLAGAVNKKLGRFLDAGAATIVFCGLAAMTWQIWLYALKLARAHETTFVLQIPVAPFWFGVGTVLFCAVLVQGIVVLRALTGIFSR